MTSGFNLAWRTDEQQAYDDEALIAQAERASTGTRSASSTHAAYTYALRWGLPAPTPRGREVL